MANKKILLILLLWQVPLWLLGQQRDSIYRLPEVEVTAPRLTHFTPGSKLQELDSATLALYRTQDLSAIITEQSLAFNKTYGLGGLATPSFRGAGANHTTLIWNGFQLQSPMNGVMDLALVPASFFSDASIHYGGSGALFGSGSVGGSIHFGNSGRFARGWDFGLGSELGSFGHFQQQARLAYSTKNYSGSISGVYQSAQNNFTFINHAKAGKPAEQQVNAALANYGLMQENYIKLHRNHLLKVWLWHQNTHRQLPPTMVAPNSRETQNDSFTRVAAEWVWPQKKFTSYVRTAVFDEWLEYAYPQANIYSQYHTQSLINEAEVRVKVRKNHLLNIGGNFMRNRALTDVYGENGAAQNRLAFFGSYKIIALNNRLEVQASIREEMVDFAATPPMPSAGASFKLRDWLKLKGNLSRTYRLPTFNDLYWVPGGNPDLKPEIGWSGEAGISAAKEDSAISYGSSLIFFSNRVSNWIIWLPTNAQHYSPRNVQEVWSRGIEADAWLQKKFTNHWRLNITGRYTYVKSENITEGAYKGKQLIYVPHHKILAGINLEKQGHGLWLHQGYTGSRFINAPNTNELPGFWLTNLRLSSLLRYKGHSATAAVRAENIFNKDYQIIAWRPMPGRAYYFSLHINLNKPLNSKSI